MKCTKKFILFVALSFSLTYLEADQPAAKKRNPVQQEMISMQQLQEMQEMEQFIGMICMSIIPDYITKRPKFIVSLLPAYLSNPELVQKKVIEKIETDPEIDALIAKIQETMGIDQQLKKVVQELKPALKQVMVQELLKWVHITASSGLKVQ